MVGSTDRHGLSSMFDWVYRMTANDGKRRDWILAHLMGLVGHSKCILLCIETYGVQSCPCFRKLPEYIEVMRADAERIAFVRNEGFESKKAYQSCITIQCHFWNAASKFLQTVSPSANDVASASNALSQMVQELRDYLAEMGYDT